MAEEFTSELGKHRAQLRRHNFLQLLRIYCLDWALPVVVGVYGVVSNFSQMQRLFFAVIQQ